MTTTYATVDGEVRDHDLMFQGQPDPSCYGCLGTGELQGFGHQGEPCHCKFTCDRHESICEPDA
jgi:hypothetical protein